MTSLGEYRLYWSCAAAEGVSCDDIKGGRGGSVEPVAPCALECSPRQLSQYVFAAQGEEAFASGLRRARSLSDLLRALAGGGSAGERAVVGAVVALIALLGGNLLATGRWRTLLVLGTVSLLLAAMEFRAGVALILATSAWLFGSSVVDGELSLQWLATVTWVVLVALTVLLAVMHWVQEDPRGYVLLLDRPGAEVAIRNQCCMDVKLLVFDGTDAVRLVPHGGLLGGVLVPRGAVHCLGDKPPYVVKVYAPWERELGSFEVSAGTYSFRATVPPLVLTPKKPAYFMNSSEEPVAICTCRVGCWTCSLWLPLAPLFTRLVWPARRVKPGSMAELDGPCELRVYSVGLLGPFTQLASCSVRKDEGVEYVGSVRWTGTRSSVRRSCSSLLEVLR